MEISTCIISTYVHQHCITNSTDTDIHKKQLILAIPIGQSDYRYTSTSTKDDHFNYCTNSIGRAQQSIVMLQI